MSAVKVVRLGGLMPFVHERVAERFGAPTLEELGDPRGVEVAVVGGAHQVGSKVMDALPDVRAIVNFGVGHDNIDVAEAGRRGIAVSNTPDVLTDAVADLTVALVLDLLRGVTAADRFVRRGAWPEGAFPLGRDVRGVKVGVLGLGRIGTAVAHRLEAFGVELGYHSRSVKDVAWPRLDSAQALAAWSEVLIVLTPGGSETEHLVDAGVLAALGPEGLLVNVARGSVVDEAALISALEDGVIAGAGLDVFADEPHVPDALLRRDDVVLLPHIGSATTETREAMAQLVIDNVTAFLERGELVTPVVP